MPVTADESRVSDFSTPKVITSRITQTGNAAAMDAACSACSPSTRSRSAATTPIDTPQTTRKRRGGWSSPMLSMVAMTNVPESDDVMNQVASRNVASADIAQTSQGISVIRSMVP